MGGWLDLKGWKRRQHYQLFRTYTQPFFSVTVDVDVTRIWKRARTRGAPSFFLTSVFFMLRAANDVEAFRLRLRPRGVWRHDRVGVGATIRRSDDTFGFARCDLADTLDTFVTRSNAAMAKALSVGKLAPAEGTDDVIYHSVLPWLRFTGYTNALRHNDSIPRIVFGRATRVGRRIRMPVAIEVHHAVVDGADVAMFFDRFNAELEHGRVSALKSTGA